MKAASVPQYAPLWPMASDNRLPTTFAPPANVLSAHFYQWPCN